MHGKHKVVDVDRLRPGMFVHELGLPWWRHGFLRQRFMLDTADDVDRVRASGVRKVVIDTERGLDPEPLHTPASPSIVAAAMPAIPSTPLPATPPSVAAGAVPSDAAPAGVAPIGSVSHTTELRTARRLFRDATRVVRETMLHARAGELVVSPQLQDLAAAMVESTARNAGALLSLTTLKTKDDYTFTHCVAVSAFMIALGRTLGLDEASLRDAGTAGLLHDVGKARVPEAVLNKPASLTPAEYEIIKAHPRSGYDMLLQADYADAQALDAVLHHHERLDGRGYPDGQAGAQIGLLARMAAVADVYDAVSSDRVYHAAMPPSAALKMLLQSAGTHFDETLVRALIRTVGIFPNGSLVRLASGRLGVVLEQNAADVRRPRVRVFYSTRSDMHVPPLEVDLARGEDRVEQAEDPRTWGFELARYRD